MSLSGQSTSGEGQKSSDSNARDAPREVPSLDHWLKLAQEELETGQSLNIDGIHTAVCIDISDSMKLGDAWKQSKEFFTQFIQGLSENQKIDDDEYVALSVFGRDVRVVQRLTKKYNHLQQAFDSLKIGGPSPLYGGLLMALAGVTSVTVGIVNGVKITSRIILVTDGHPTNPLLITGSDDYDPDKKRKNQVTAIQAADIIASKRVRIDCVPVGDADVPFLDVIASRTQGKVYSYTDGKMLGRRTTTYCCAGHILSMWRMMSLFGSSVDTDTLLEVMIDLHAPDQITSLSQDEQEEVLEIAKDAFKTDEFLDVIRELEVNYEFDDPDVKLPDLGTRVRLVRDSNNSQRDECGPGTIVGHHRNKTQVRVEWDSNKKAELYYFGEKENNEVEIVNEPRILQPNQLIATGCHVKRGKDWKWGDQDGTPGTIGVVVKVQDDGLVWVRWPDKRKNMYRFGAKGRFDLEICPPVSRTANSATTPRQSSPPQPGPKSEDESFSDPLSSKSSQKGKDKIEEIYTRTAVKTSTQQSPTQRGLTSTTSTNMIPTTTTDTSIPATTTIMMTSSTTHVVTRNTTTTDSTSSLTTVMAASSETLTPSVLNMPSSIATNTIQNTTFLENEGASRSGNSLLSSSEPVSTSTQTTATTSRDSSSDSTQTATNTGNLGLSESVSRVSNTYWDELAKRELVEAQMINTPGIHTVICVDTSESMRQGSAWKETQQFFDEFIEEMEMITKETDIKDEQIALSVFGQEVKVVQRLCKNYRQLREAFRILKIGGPTPMCGGLKMALAGFANPGKTGILNRELEGLRMALAGITCISIPVINGIIIPPRIIIITDGHPTDTLLSSGPDVRVSTEEAKSDVIKAVRKISKRKISIHIVPVGDADESFLSLIASKADGQIVTYTEGRKLARRAINNLYAGIVLQQWKKDNEIGRLFDTEMSLEDVMDVPVDSRIASLSEENKVEVLHTDKQAIEKGLLDNDVEDELEKYHYESDGKKVDLPPLGTRVRRATNSDRQIQDDDGLGTIVGQHKIKKQVRVEWDRNGKSDFCRYGDEEKYDVIIVNEHRILQSNEQIAVGCHVKRGKDWRWGNQGGKPDAVGVVIRVKDDKWVSVRWPDKSKNVYRFGADGCFDLQLCDPSGNAIEGQTTRGITKSEQISTLQLCLENPASLLPQLLSMVKKHSDMTQKESLASYNPDIKLSPVGTQARRGSDSASGQQDENSPESIIVHHKDKICNPDESQTADGTTTSAQTSTPLKQSVPSSFIMSNLQSLMKKIVKIDRNAGRRFKELDDPDVKLPSLGTRVRRGPDWDRGQQDDDGPGTIISHHKNKRQVLVEWDNNGTCDFYRFDEKDKQDVMVVNEPRVLQANERIATGCRVKRGKDWKWDYQDGTPGAEGVVIQVQDDDMVWVRWPHKKRNIYRYGREGCFDLEVCNPDEKYTVGLQTQPGHLLNVQMHESSRTPSKVPTAGNISDMEKNGSTSTVSLMNTSTMQPPTFINTMMASNDTSSLPTETITTTGCTITAKTPVHETQISTFATTLSVTSNTITGLPVRFDRTKNIHYKPGSELGRGCYGNIIYKGRFDERDVAVNRLLKENFSFAEQEIELLRQSDQRPNVIRYYWNEHDDHFLYIALELCEETLQGYVEDKLSKIKKLKPIDLLHQIMKGLEYLHSLGIVHRDLKPHNILISRPSAQGEVRALISDFGLSRMLPPGKQSFSSKSDVYGAEGWAAPEMSITSQNKHESSRTPSKVPTAGNISDMEKNGSTSTVSIMNTSTMQQPTFINETMGSYDTSSSPTEAITTTDCTIAAKTPAQQTQISTIATTSSVTSNTITGLPVRLDRTKNIYYKPESELGRGCYGTIVYKGNFDERDVAVKRLLKENFSFAEREIELLRQSDQHPNVIRYYWNEHDDHFLYIALELCEGTLQDYVEDKLSKIKKLEPIELLRQTMNGLTYLHSLGIVHRDLKPHNILISRPSAQGEVRALISDFGLSKKLPPGKQSFSSKSDVYGTEGWAAPEMSITSQNKTLAVDIFSAGCVMHYTLTRGKHPFGDKPFQIQSRIQKGKFKLDELPTTSDGYIAKDIIRDMLSSIPEARPTANDVLQHLLFWNKDVKLRFIEDTSDWMLTNMFPILETHPDKMFELDWTKPLSQELKDDLRYDTRGYDTSSVTDLLRLIRNKRHHYNQLPEDVQKSLGSVPDEYLDYFTSRFPLLLIHTYQVMKCCSKEDAFKAYYKHT